MNILFISSNHNVTNVLESSLDFYSIGFGISYISSVLKVNGYNTKLLYLTSNKNINNILDNYLQSFSPKLVCFTFVSTEFPFVADIAQKIRKNYPAAYLLAGGPHASLCPDECISAPFDALCIGEGEEPTLELVQQLGKGILPSNIRNLWIKRGPIIEKNPTRPFISIDNLPFPDREMCNEWISAPPTSMAILLGRGCPFLCSYCCNHALRKISPGIYVRLRSLDSIIKEIREIINEYPLVVEIYLEVETFGIDLDWSIKLCERLAELNASIKEPLCFGVNLRITPNIKLDDLFNALKIANFKSINIGLESGSDKIRRKILNRKESNEDILKAVQLAKKHGIKVNFYNMIGIPGETYDDFLKTISINRYCLPNQARSAIFYPYPGTNLFKLCKDWGLIDKNLDHDMEREKATLDLPGFPKRQIQRSYVWFDYLIYKGHKPTHKLLLGVFNRQMHVTFYLDRFYMLTIYESMKKLKDLMKKIAKIIKRS